MPGEWAKGPAVASHNSPPRDWRPSVFEERQQEKQRGPSNENLQKQTAICFALGLSRKISNRQSRRYRRVVIHIDALMDLSLGCPLGANSIMGRRNHPGMPPLIPPGAGGSNWRMRAYGRRRRIWQLGHCHGDFDMRCEFCSELAIASKNEVVGPDRFELSTYGLRVRAR